MRVPGSLVFAGVLLSTLPARAQTPVTYTLTIEPVPNGYVIARGIDCGAGRTDCQETFLPSDVVELQAVPLEGYYFLGWKGNVCIGDASATVAMSYNRSCTALFAANPASGLPESQDYSDVVFLESELVGIGPPLPPGTKNRQVYMPDGGGPGPTFVSPYALSFVFYSLAGEWRIGFRAEPGGTLAVGSYDFISPEWAGGGQLAFSGPWGTSCGYLDLPTGESAWVSPSRFVVHEIQWNSPTLLQRFAADFEIVCSASVTIVGSIRYNSTRTALQPFDGAYPVHRLLVDPTTGGSVTATGISCGEGHVGPCQVDYSSPTLVTLTAEASPGYQFMGWGGACQGSTLTTQVNVSSERKCLAAFNPLGNDPIDPSLSQAVWLVDFHRNGAPPVREFKWPGVARVSTFRTADFLGPTVTVTSSWTVLPWNRVPLQDWSRGIRITFRNGVIAPGDYTEVYSGTNGIAPALEMFDQLSQQSFPLTSTAYICVPSVARVRVYEAVVDASGRLMSFAADFEALCRPGSYTYMVGVVRFNSSRTSLQPFDSDSPLRRLNIERPPNGRVVASGIDCGAGPHTDCTENFAGVTDLRMQAIPSPGYEFVAWTGACKGAATMNFRVDWSRTCSAVFSPVVPGFGVEDPRARNAFLLDGAPGNPFVTGRHLFANSAVIAPLNGGVHPTWAIVNVFLPDGRWWIVRLRVPHDQVLRPGAFDARLFGSNPSAEPQLSVLVNSSGCSPDLFGRFVIHEISFATVSGNLTLASLAVDFEQRCSAGAPPLAGSLRYNSSYLALTPFKPLAAPAPAPRPDLNGDGWPDLVWRHATTGRNAVWLMQDAVTQATLPLTPASAATVTDNDWEIRTVADFNTDGRADLVWQHKTTGRFAVWFMSGATLVSTSGFLTLSGTSTETETDWKLVAAGDFNRDKQTDLLWWNQTSGALRVWHMSGVEQWNAVDVPLAVTDTQWQVAGVGDLNGDGWLDIVWRHYGHGAVATWFMVDTSVVQTVRLSPASVNDIDWRIVGVADMDRDGSEDLVWQHRTNGRLGIWYMNGTTLVRTTMPGPGVVADLNWRIVAVR